MKFGVPWSVRELRPEARETAKQAARRSGMSLGDWLNAVILQQAAQQGLHARAQGADDFYGEDVASVHQRLDDLTRRIEQMTRSGPAAYAPKRAAAAPPNLAPGLDRAVAEIAARQRALNGEPARAQPRALLPTQDISGLEEQLRSITDQIEMLRKPGVEEAINALRTELGEISQTLNDAMPRRAIDILQRIAEGRQAGVDHDALTGIEHGLAEVRDALRGLTPAEQLVGFHEAIHGLAHKIDLIVAQKDPETLAQLENAISTLRSLSMHIASSDAVSGLAAEVQLLGQKVDYIAHAAGSSALDNLEHRISAIGDALAERAQNGGAAPPQLEALVQSLSDKIEQIQSSRGDDVALGHLEDRIVKLVEKLDASESRLGQLEAIERGLSDLLVHIEDMRANRQPGGLRAEPSPAVDEIKQDIARTQDALNGMHSTLALVVDRLAKIEHDIRGEGRGPAAPEEAVPALPGKIAVRAVSDAQAEPARMPKTAPLQMPAPQPVAPPPSTPPQAASPPVPLQQARRRAATSLPIDPDLPPDQPLEPGSSPPKFSARIAASEAALGGAARAAPAPAGRSSFIAAARRATQAALQQAPSALAPAREEADELDEAEQPSMRGKLMKRVKSLFVAASIIAIVAGGAQILGKKFDLGGGGTNPAKTGKVEVKKTEKVARATDPAPLSLSPDQPGPVASTAPPLAAPPAPPAAGAIATTPFNPATANSLLNPPVLNAPASSPRGDITGSISRSFSRRPPPGQPAMPEGEQLPIAIGGPKLRQAALAGDGAAEYEVAMRFADGRGVPTNVSEAARWFERAANTGFAPAQFRYASMLEKGQGVKKDLAAARRLYLLAAAKGNAKAMHNLAVLYADGIDGKPNYAIAVKWFREAAEHGLADSQYNLGVLAARGLGTEKSFAESYKWFALAAAKGDPESAKKRDQVAAQLDPKLLAQAQQAVKAFVPQPQPEAATMVPKPAGGWDNATAGAPAPKAKAKPQPHQPPHAPLSLGSFTVGKR